MTRRIAALLLTLVLTFCALGAAAETVGVGEGPTIEVWECQWGGDGYEEASKKIWQQATDANIGGMGLKFDVSVLSWQGYSDTFLTAVTSRTAPDIALEGSTSALMYAQMDEVLDLTPLVERWKAEGGLLAQEIPQAGLDFFNYNGVQTALPWGLDANGFFYNKELLSGAGIETLPTTWDELYDVCGKLKEVYPDIVPIAAAGAESTNLNHLMYWFFFSNDASKYTEDIKAGVTEPNAIEALTIFKKFFDAGYFGEGLAGYTSADAQRLFQTEQAAFIAGGFPSYARGTELYDKIGTLKPITGPSAKDGGKTIVSFQAIYAFKQTENPEAVYAALDWWFNNNSTTWLEGNNAAVPIRASVQQELYADDPAMLEFLEISMANGHNGMWPLGGLYEFETAIDSEGIAGIAFMDIMTGSSVEDAAAHCAEEINEVLADYGY